MERIKKIRNPYQDRINALNAKNIEEGLKSDALLKTSREPIPNDINDDRFPMTDILPPNVLKPEDLSMKDLLDELQIQTILNKDFIVFINIIRHFRKHRDVHRTKFSIFTITDNFSLCEK